MHLERLFSLNFLVKIFLVSEIKMLYCQVLIVLKFAVIETLFLQQFVMTFGIISRIRKQLEVGYLLSELFVPKAKQKH